MVVVFKVSSRGAWVTQSIKHLLLFLVQVLIWGPGMEPCIRRLPAQWRTCFSLFPIPLPCSCFLCYLTVSQINK